MLPRISFNPELSYKLESYRNYIYSPLWLFWTFWLLTNTLCNSYWSNFIIKNIETFLLLVVYSIVYIYFTRLSRWVSFYALIQMERDHHGSYEMFLIKQLGDKIKNLPYIETLFSVTLAIGSYFYISFKEIKVQAFDFSDMWSVHATILGLIFAVLTFLINLLGSNEANKSIGVGRKIATDTNFIWITIINLLGNLTLGFLSIFVPKDNLLNALSIFIFSFLIFSVIFLFRRLIRYSVEQDLLQVMVLNQRRDCVRRSLTNEIRDKISHYLFTKFIEPLQVCFSYHQEISHAFEIKSKNKGRVIDINIILLKKLSHKIAGLIQVRNYVDRDDETYKAAVHKSFDLYSYVSDRKDLLANIPNKEENRKLLPKFPNVFKLGKAEDDPVRRKLKDLTNDLVKSVNVSPRNSVEILESWSSMVEESLQTMKDYKLEYDHKNSKDTTTLDWSTIGILTYGLFDILNAVSKSKDSELVENLVRFLNDQIEITYEYKNYFLLKELLFYFIRTHYFSLVNLEEEPKKNISQSLARKIETFTKYKIDLTGEEYVDDLTFEFDSNVRLQIQNNAKELIRISLNRQYLLGVQIFIKTLDKVSTTLDNHRGTWQLKNQIDLIDSGHTPEGINNLTEYKAFLLKLISLNERLEKRKYMMIFALGAWTVELYRRNKISNELIFDFLRNFQSYFRNNLKLFIEIYFDLKDFHREEELDLSSWVIDEDSYDSGGFARTINLDWLNYFYVLTMLEFLGNENIEYIYGKDVHKNSSPSLDLTLKEVEDTISKIRSSKDFWIKLLNPTTETVFDSDGTTTQEEIDNLSKSNKLIELHKIGIEKRKEEEREFLSNASIDPAKWESFQQDFWKNYKEAFSIKNIVRKYGRSVKLKVDSLMKDSFGIITLDFKYVFIDKWYISTLGHAENFANAMVRGENDRILTNLIEKSKKLNPLEPQEDILSKINSTIEDLRKLPCRPNVLFMGDYNKLFLVKNSSDFISASAEEKSVSIGYEGTYRGLAVFRVHEINFGRKTLIADLSKLGILMEAPYPEGDIKLSVHEITTEDIDGWVEKNAKILEKQDGTRMTREEAIKIFADRVHLEILEKMEYRKSKEQKVKYSRYFDIS